jgi:hypothetical protein
MIICNLYKEIYYNKEKTNLKEYNLLSEIYNNFKVIYFYLQNEQSFILLIFYATHRESAPAKFAEHVGSATVEKEGA